MVTTQLLLEHLLPYWRHKVHQTIHYIDLKNKCLSWLSKVEQNPGSLSNMLKSKEMKPLLQAAKQAIQIRYKMTIEFCFWDDLIKQGK